jgi:CDP-4-dehydro-6-deoxyglucose reductase
MPKLTFNSTTFELNQYETVLDCLLRHQQSIPYACRAGMCQACLIKAVDCNATQESKKWIKEVLQEKGYTLACQWVPDSDVAAALPTIEEFSVETSLRTIEALNDQVLRATLDVMDKSAMFHYYPGQYVTLISPRGITRSYSVANAYEEDGFLEFHVSKTTQGIFTGWLFGEAKPGDILHMRGPNGDCFYSNTSAETYPIILAGTGTGLAPLYGIIRDALKQGHEGQISLFHSGHTTDNLYYVKELESLQQEYSQFQYLPCAREKNGNQKVKGLQHGSIEEVVDANLDTGALNRTRVFLCGAPDLVHGLRKQIFMKGVSAGNIHCDPFLERSVAPTGGTN